MPAIAIGILVVAVFIACIAISSRIRLDNDSLRCWVATGWCVVSVFLYGLAIALDVAWPIVLWFWSAGLMLGIPVGDLLHTRKERGRTPPPRPSSANVPNIPTE